ncbi:hypothetical protein DPV78_011190 [Talaromyces pinophilus]|nr:hypothetical protein DPV78_011190 [Talaromyces pinophilus]
MTELTPFRFGIGPPPRPKPPKSRPQSMGQSGMATALGASVAAPGNESIGITKGNPGANSAAPMHPAAVSTPSVNPSSAANGAVSGATTRPVHSVQTPGVPGMNGYAADTMPGVSGMPVSGVETVPTAPTSASMPAQTTDQSTSAPTENASPAPIRGGRGIALSEEDKVLLLKICVESQNTLKFSTKTAFWRRVSNRFETIRGGRQYSAVSCERAVTKWTDARRASLKKAGGKRVLSEAQKFTLLVDQMVGVQDEVEHKAKEKEAELREIFERMEGGYYGTSTQTPARTDNQQDETRASPSIFDHNTPHGSNNSNATSPEIDITDTNIITLNTTHNKDDDPMDFESTVISELSKIRSLVTHEATASVATTNFLKKNHQSLKSQLDRLEDKFKDMQKTLDQQTGILSDQNTVLKQILTMMSHGRRSPMTPGPPFQGPPPPHGAPYYPPHPGPPYYPYYQGPAFQGPPPQGFPPQGPQTQAQSQNTQPQPQPPQTQGAQPQGTKPQGTQLPGSQPPSQLQDSQTPGTQPQASQSQSPPAQEHTQPQTQFQAQPQGLPPQATQAQGPPPPQGKFAVFSGWVS